MLKKWSLVIYGTAEQPYPVHHQRARSAEIPIDEDLTESYNGETNTLIFHSSDLSGNCSMHSVANLQYMIIPT